MSSDSQDIVLIEGGYDILPMGVRWEKNKIERLRGKEFAALVGYVGTEEIGGLETSMWFKAFIAAHVDDTMAAFCHALAGELSGAWLEHQLDTCLWVFITGYDDEARFWYVVNLPSDGAIDPTTLAYRAMSRAFRAVCDLDDNYLPNATQPGESKQAVLRRTLWYFRNGVLLPAAAVSDTYTQVVRQLVFAQIPGFPKVETLETYAYLARQRMEFVKRLYQQDHGLYEAKEAPIAGGVYVYSIEPDRTFRVWEKIRDQSKVVV